MERNTNRSERKTRRPKSCRRASCRRRLDFRLLATMIGACVIVHAATVAAQVPSNPRDPRPAIDPAAGWFEPVSDGTYPTGSLPIAEPITTDTPSDGQPVPPNWRLEPTQLPVQDLPPTSVALPLSADTNWPGPTVHVGGRIHIDSTLFPTASPGIGFFENPGSGADPLNRLEFRRLRVEVSGTIHENMFYKLDFEFSNPNNPQILDAYVGFQDVPFFQTIILGNQLRPLGFDVMTSSNDVIFMESPLVFGDGNVDSRRIGVLSRGYSADESTNWQYGFFELPNVQNNGQYLFESFEGSLNARLTRTPFYSSGGQDYVHWGVNAAFFSANDDAELQSKPELRTQSAWIDTDDIDNSDWANTSGIEGLINLGSLSIGGEWNGSTVHRTGGDSELFFDGGYLYVAYFLTGEYQPFDRKLGVLSKVRPLRNFSPSHPCCGGPGAWQVAARISYFDLSDDDVLGGDESNFTLGLNWWLNPDARFMFNFVTGNISNHEPAGGFTGGHFSGLAMRFQVQF